MSPFEITILGCSSATPTPDRHPSAQLVNLNEHFILIDCGEGTQTQLLQYHIRYSRISYILISHLHGDHFLGLPGLLSTMSLNGRTDPITLIGPQPLLAFLQQFFSISETTLRFEVRFIPANPSEAQWVLEEEHFRIMSFPLQHRIPCTGFIIKERRRHRKIDVGKCEEAHIPVGFYQDLKEGKDYIFPDGKIVLNSEVTIDPAPERKYAYCSDTIYDPQIIQYIQHADLLYHESTFMSDRKMRAAETYHTTAQQAGKLANDARVSKLIIGHFSARYNNLEMMLEEAKAEFAPVELALEGKVFQV